jgi:hypothetical protein
LKTAAAIAVLLLPGASSAQQRPPLKSIISKSRQYTISSTVLRPRPVRHAQQTPIPNRVHLTPDKLAHFAENVKDHLLRQLQLPPRDKWVGRIHLNIIPGKLGDRVLVEKTRFLDGWRYRLDLPEVMSGTQLTRTIMAVQLEEYAARNTRTVPPLPAWLAEGLAERILQSTGPILFVAFQSSAGGTLNFQFPTDPMQNSRRIIQASPPVSFLNLTLPPDTMKTDAGRQVLRAHSHLLVDKLLALPHGARLVKNFLRELPRHKNSQHAFLIAFGYKNMLQAEQWWMLAQTQFRSRDGFNRWIPGLTMARLADILKVHVPSPPQPGAQPRPALLSIQQFLKTGTRQGHLKILDPLLQRLLVIQINAPPKMAKLTRDYRETLGLYLGRKINLNLRRRPTSQVALLEVTLQKLNELNVIFADLRTLRAVDEARGKIIAEPRPRR